jgi:hypothetical protein
LVGIVGTDDVTISNTGTFATATVGTAIAVTSTQTLAGADAAKYTVTLPTGLVADITPKALTIATAVAQNKFFDGTTTATITGTLTGVIAPDAVTLTLSGTFASSAVGTGIAVTSTSTIAGVDAANYSLTQPTGLTANILAVPTFTEVIFPQYIQGLNGTNNNRIPFAYRATLADLTPNATYRFYNAVDLTTALPTSNGAGNNIFTGATPGDNFTYSTGPSLSTVGNYGTFTTDATGSYTGWFIIAPSGNATRFVPGNILNTRIILNDGNGGTSVSTVMKSNQTIQVINTVGSAGANNGTGLWGASSAVDKNFVFVYDNTAGTGRPLSGTFVENDGAAQVASFATFYTANVNGVSGAYGLIVPNTNANGVQRIEQRDFTTGAIAGCPATDADGVWPSGANTVNPTGGTTAIAITSTDANLNNSGSENVTTISSCDSYTWANTGITYTTSGIYTGTTTNCITEKLNLTITTISVTASATNVTCFGLADGTITATATGGATITVNGSALANPYGPGTYTIVATAANASGTANCTATTTVTITEPIQPSITASANAGGIITPSGTTTLACGASQTYTIVPDAGYQIASILINGVNNPAAVSAGSYTFTNVTSGQTIQAVFQVVAITASVLSGSATICNGQSANLSVTITGGTAPFTIVYSDGSNNFTVNNYNSGSNISVTPTVTTSYSLISVTDALSNAGTGNSGTATITVNQNLTISASANTGGTITPSGTTTLACGSSQTYTFSASSGYQILLLLIDGINNPAAAALGSYTFTNATGNHTIQAVFQTSPATAQVEATTYRGAFAPSPVAMWTDNWTNWDPQNTFYAAPTVNVSGVITTNTTWTKNNVYLLQGLVFVDSLVTLTIEAGTVVRGDANTIISTLVVQRGGKLIANGTPCNPIVFTSSKAAGSRVKGDWGGITLLGKGLNNLGTDVPIEGIGNSNVRGRHGGTDNTDNSGSLKYVRIEYAGFAIAANNELNSLTFGSVGSGTTIDYVQTSFGNDDAFEWFGGAVNCKHLVAYRTLDDDFDTDNGYSGTVQFGLAIKDPAVSDDPNPSPAPASTSEGFESDNNGSSPFTILPKTSASFYNITQIGAYRCTNNLGGITNPTAPLGGFRRGARLRRNTELKIFNSILMNNWRGLVMDADVIANGLGAFKNNIVAMDYTFSSTVPGATGLALAAENAATSTYLTALANTNTIVSTPCDVLVNAWDFLNPDYRPNGAGTGAALAGCDLTPGINIETALFTANQTAEVVVDIFENAVGNSNGTITVTIPVPSAWTVAVLGGPALTATPTTGTNGTAAALGVPYNNGDWLFSLVGGNVIATSKVGVTIPSAGSASLGFTVKRNATTPGGTNQSLSATVSGGGDVDATNNGALSGLGAN